MSNSEFDAYANDYESALAEGLSASGESADYFAQGRVLWLRSRLKSIRSFPSGPTVLDFGCGTGNSIEYLLKILDAKHVTGLDTSTRSLDLARARYPSHQTKFLLPSEFKPSSDIDLAYCNGVFHHIPLADRPQAFETIYKSLRPQGIFAFWENNPWNPGTRWIMSRILFDRDAITISPSQSKKMLKNAGFMICTFDSCFYFPRLLSWLRPFEALLCKIPLGAQYLVVAQKP